MSPLEWVQLFAGFAKVGKDVVESFTQAHPELIDEHHPKAPAAAPSEDIDPEVLEAIRRGRV